MICPHQHHVDHPPIVRVNRDGTCAHCGTVVATRPRRRIRASAGRHLAQLDYDGRSA